MTPPVPAARVGAAVPVLPLHEGSRAGHGWGSSHSPWPSLGHRVGWTQRECWEFKAWGHVPSVSSVLRNGGATEHPSK